VFGPGGTAMIVEIMTDNRNRTASEIRNVLTKHGGHLGASGSVTHMFRKLGVIAFDKAAVDENLLTDKAIELGADDIRTEGEALTVYTEPKEFERIREALAKAEAKIPAPLHAEVTMVPQNLVHVAGGDAEKVVKLVSSLEDHDDVQNVHSNIDVDESVLESVG